MAAGTNNRAMSAVYRIDWNALVDRTLVAELAAAAGVDPAPALTDVRLVLARILEAAGGWPYATSKPSAAAQRQFAHCILADAVAQVRGPARWPMPGFTRAGPRNGMRAISLTARTEVNRADAATLTQVPGLSRGLADAIVAGRLDSGAYRDLGDLTSRVSGIGPKRARQAAPYLSFAPPGGAAAGTSGDLAPDLQALMAQEPDGAPSARLQRVLERVAMQVASNRHPHTCYQLPRPPKTAALPTTVAADRIRVLSGHRYYYLLKAAIDRAREKVDVAMFHIALPSANHPTRKLLDALSSAHGRGVRVRVLVDRDRPEDPYHSVAVNAGAIRYLLDGGVTVRVDAPARLLHSKLVVIDDGQTIIGSHNWSAGSYFSFDDLSLDIICDDFARTARERFDTLWHRGTRASAS
jgi:hypothetical protein